MKLCELASACSARESERLLDGMLNSCYWLNPPGMKLCELPSASSVRNSKRRPDEMLGSLY